MIDWLTEPFQYIFMQNALLAIVLAGFNCALIGSYVVLRRMAFMGEALTHTILPGIVFAYLKGIELFIGALAASLLTALGVGFLSSRKDIRDDTAIGVMLATMFAIGVLMMGFIHSYRDFGSILFGSILGVTQIDLILIGSTTAFVLITLICIHKELELASFDRDYSQLIGASPRFLQILLLILVALSVVSAVQMIGALLTTALLIIPAATACLLANSLLRIMVISSIIAIASGFIGLLLSYHFHIASGAAIVLTCAAWFFVSWGWKLVRK